MTDLEFTLLGDAIWLDFVNTARGRTPSPPDLLSSDAAVLRWAQAQQIEVNGDLPPLEQVRQLRERLTWLAEALHTGGPAPTVAIAAINEELTRSSGCHQLTRVSGAWQLRFAPSNRLDLLQAIARSAAASLSDPLLAIRRCAGDGCSLFFSDNSSNQSRRWCIASVCGREVRVERRRGLLR